MTLKKKLLVGISIGLLALVGVFYWVNQTFFSNSLAPSNTVTMGPDGQPLEDELAYSTFSVFTQEPVTVDATVKLQTDTAYFYEASKGKINSVLVKDGQSVKKGAVLFTYVSDNKESQYALEDLKREQTKLYNQRESLIEDLGELTGNYYNYQGDQIAQYWGNDGKQAYYIVEEIGSTTQASTEDASVASEGISDGGAESIKEQIRQLNSQIEDLEIKLVRQLEGQNDRVLAQTDGTVILNEDGQSNASIPLVRIISEKQSVVGSVTEYDFYALAEDRAVSIFIPAENRTVAGTIVDYDKIPAYSGTNAGSDSGATGSNGLSQGSGTSASQFGFVVEAEQSLQPGFSAKVNITLPGYVIPAEALVEEGDGTYVFVYENGRAKKTKIDLIQQGLQKVVLKGLQEGDQLVMMPYDLQDGQEISVMDPLAFEGMEETFVGE